MDNKRLVESVETALKSLNISHGELNAGLPRNNYSVSDSASLFCKIAGPGAHPDNLARELKAALTLNGLSIKPLINTIVVTSSGPMTVWEYRDGVTLTPEHISPELVEDIIPPLLRIHENDISLVDNTMQSTIDTVNHRLAHPSWKKLPKDLNGILMSLIEKFIFTMDTSFEGRDLVVCHGDAHMGNVIFTKTGALWCDFESVRLAPKEWDFAGLRHNLLRIGGRKDAWDHAYELIRERVDVDEKLLDRLETIKIVAAITYLVSQEAWDSCRQRVEAMAPVITGGPLPLHLAAHTGR